MVLLHSAEVRFCIETHSNVQKKKKKGRRKLQVIMGVKNVHLSVKRKALKMFYEEGKTFNTF